MYVYLVVVVVVVVEVSERENVCVRAVVYMRALKILFATLKRLKVYTVTQ